MAANQSRRRTELENPPHLPAKPCLDFTYEPLNKNVDCTRLLSIHSADNIIDPIVCTLSTIEFCEKPRYEALSYAWGTNAIKPFIHVNGHRFLVGQNLWNALHYLRGQGRKMPIWVDAICINQNDIPERNRQLRIMHHIYSRATTVVVWLGETYSTYHQTVEELLARQPSGTATTTCESPSDLKSHEEISTAGKGVKIESDMAKKLYHDEYWQRVWIIQEIGLAERIEVCFGSSAPMDWNSFIHLVTMHNLGSEGPIRLSRLRQDRDNGSHTLRNLLQDHRDAKCKERRDKVYGLIGLAADAHRFPMDYTKPLIEVWTDVMHYTKHQGLLAEEDTIPFGALVKYLLMGNECTPLEQVLRPYRLENDLTTPVIASQEPVSFWMTGFIIGQVRYVGATTTDIISKLDSVDDWNEKVQELFHHEVGVAHLESRTLIRAILSRNQIRTCFNHTSKNWWEINAARFADNSHYFSIHRYMSLAELQKREDDEGICKVVATSADPRLVQLINNLRPGRGWRMGVSSPQTKRGDLLVWIAHIKHSIVVRIHKTDGYSARLQVVGTAWLTCDMASPAIDHMDRLGSFQYDEKIPVAMDAETIFVLLSQSQG